MMAITDIKRLKEKLLKYKWFYEHDIGHQHKNVITDDTQLIHHLANLLHE
jgi:hypothetical protein